MINEWMHVTIGASGFDVLVREIGGEVYRDECFRKSKQGTRDRYKADEGEMQHEEQGGILHNCDERAEVAWDQAVVLMTVENRMDEHAKGSFVNSREILNERNHTNSNYYSGNGRYAKLKAGEDFQG
ncbi:hypothetical protein AAHE18_02G007500 [Arachis hypogaea]